MWTHSISSIFTLITQSFTPVNYSLANNSDIMSADPKTACKNFS